MSDRPLRWTGISGISPADPWLSEPNYWRDFGAWGTPDGSLLILGGGVDAPSSAADTTVGGYTTLLMAVVQRDDDRCLIDILGHRCVIETRLGDTCVAATFAGSAQGPAACTTLQFMTAAGRDGHETPVGAVDIPLSQSTGLRDPSWPEINGWVIPGKPLTDSPAPNVSARFLRSLPLGRLERRAAQCLEEFTTAAERMQSLPDLTGETRRGAVRLEEGLSLLGRPGRRGRSDEDYLPLVLRYLELAKTSRRPLVELAASLEHSAEPLTVAQIRDRIYEARRRGLLTRAGADGTKHHGKFGGSLTDYARQLLAEQKEGTDGLG